MTDTLYSDNFLWIRRSIDYGWFGLRCVMPAFISRLHQSSRVNMVNVNIFIRILFASHETNIEHKTCKSIMDWSRLLANLDSVIRALKRHVPILHWLAVTSECFDLLLVSLASNKSQQHISPQWPHRGHQSQARDIGRQLGWSRAKLLSVLISYCRITDYASLPGESSLPRVTWRPPRTCTQVAAKIIRGICQQNNTLSLCLPSFFPIFCVAKYKEDEGIYFSHTKGRMGVYYKFDNKIFITKIKCG